MDKLKNLLLFDSLFKNAGVGIAVVGGEGIPIKVNTKLCDLLGYSEDELLVTRFKDFTYPEDVEKDLGLFSELLSGVIDSYEMEKRYIRKDGRVFWGMLTVSMARQADGTATVMGMVQDIDSKKKAEEELLESQTLLKQHNTYKDKIFSIIAHDLRGPVNNTAKALELIEKSSGSFSKEKVVNLISKLRRSADTTAEMLESLLVWSQSQFRQLKFEPVSLALRVEAEKVVGQLQQQASDKNIPVQIDVPDGLWVRADKQMLHLILRNLLSNAIKFSEASKAVRLEAAKSCSIVHVSVKDEGVGLSPESISRLSGSNADCFTSWGTKGEKGTGLGINLCKSCIEMHGGSLQIQSEEGMGSRFTFSLPASTTVQSSGALCSLGSEERLGESYSTFGLS